MLIFFESIVQFTDFHNFTLSLLSLETEPISQRISKKIVEMREDSENFC